PGEIVAGGLVRERLLHAGRRDGVELLLRRLTGGGVRARIDQIGGRARAKELVGLLGSRGDLVRARRERNGRRLRRLRRRARARLPGGAGGRRRRRPRCRGGRRRRGRARQRGRATP